MMYNSKFVASIKCDGSILRENGETVYLPFGSEYSILLKNLESRKALVGITIDGEDVLDGVKLVISPNETVNLERFYNRKNKFKFIEKTEKISEHRGDRIDDGLIRISFKFEQQRPVYLPRISPYKEYTDLDLSDPHVYKYSDASHTGDTEYALLRGTTSSYAVSNEPSNTFTTSCSCCPDGITVAGSYSNNSLVVEVLVPLNRRSTSSCYSLKVLPNILSNRL